MDIEKAMKWIDQEYPSALERLAMWASINSWSENKTGLLMMEEAIKVLFSPLADETKAIPLDPWKRMNEHGNIYLTELGNALLFSKKGKLQILLGGHMDTVFPPNIHFPIERISGEILAGPGVADMKGGLLVLWLALAAFEKFRGTSSLGWKVFINPDEEIGSPGSCPEWEKQAKGVKCALLFEPSYPDGALVNVRKGSYTASIFIKGTPAHVGRDFEKGKSAVKALASWIQEAYRETEKYPGMRLNISSLSSSLPVNIIPEEAKCVINLRSFNKEDLELIKKDFEKISYDIERKEEVMVNIFQEGGKSPKPWTIETAALFEKAKVCAGELGIDFELRESGGLSDGNILAGLNVPTVDTLGVVGGGLHTEKEYMLTASLKERAKLTCLLLFSLGNHDVKK